MAKIAALVTKPYALVLGLVVTTLLGALMFTHLADDKVIRPDAVRASARGNFIVTGQWANMPGAYVKTDGLHISYRNFQIVEQDGSGGQPNPPLNLYGTHLAVPRDFFVSITLAHIHGVASVQLYGAVPVIQDEFRLERQSVRLSIYGSQLIVNLWDGRATQDLAKQQPWFTRAFGIRFAAQDTIEIRDKNGQLEFTANGRTVGHASDRRTFKSGQVWVGASADSRNGSFVISALKASSLDAGKRVESINIASSGAVPKGSDGLQALATKKHRGFLVGAAMALAPLASDDEYRRAALSNFGSMTTENALKWQFTEPQPGVYDLSEARAMVDIAKKNHLAVHGHTLVFSEGLPQWVQQLPTGTPRQKAYVEKVMTAHITYLVSHLPTVASWDVVNEPFADYSSFDAHNYVYRENVFYRAMGAGYIKIALDAAHQANPTAKLYINDYGDEIDTGERWNATYGLLKHLTATGVPLNGFGFESHIYDPQTDAIVNTTGEATTLERHINELAALGLSSRISEMDVDNGNGPAWQAQQFAGVLRTCVNLWPHCVSFTVWGVSDRYDMWQTGHHQLRYGQDLLLDSAMRPTVSYGACQKALESQQRNDQR